MKKRRKINSKKWMGRYYLIITQRERFLLAHILERGLLSGELVSESTKKLCNRLKGKLYSNEKRTR